MEYQYIFSFVKYVHTNYVSLFNKPPQGKPSCVLFFVCAKKKSLQVKSEETISPTRRKENKFISLTFMKIWMKKREGNSLQK